eukprot:TRINITY_DN628_c0_g2_i1.p3 TRINITY_DN628_c0_g2~~TRINITY_DN628_c0_g2_i1.p3  ORF type:complete len:223 (+),score=82.36 TRINITY_DN628_c0_g2_i1:12-680(+)
MMSSQEEVRAQFAALAEGLQQEEAVRERVAEAAAALATEVVRACHALTALHTTANTNAAAEAAVVRELNEVHVPRVVAVFVRLGEVLPTRRLFYRHYRLFRRQVATMVTCLALVTWLRDGSLVTMEAVEAALGFPSHFLPLNTEDYLQGVAALPAELTRLSVNSAMLNMPAVPAKVNTFLQQLYSSFQMLGVEDNTMASKLSAVKQELRTAEAIAYQVALKS